MAARLTGWLVKTGPCQIEPPLPPPPRFVVMAVTAKLEAMTLFCYPCWYVDADIHWYSGGFSLCEQL